MISFEEHQAKRPHPDTILLVLSDEPHVITAGDLCVNSFTWKTTVCDLLAGHLRQGTRGLFLPAFLWSDTEVKREGNVSLEFLPFHSPACGPEPEGPGL